MLNHPIRSGLPACAFTVCLLGLLWHPACVAAGGEDTLASIVQRLDALEQQNREMALQIEELTRQNVALQAAVAAPAAAHAGTVAAAPAPSSPPSPAAAKTGSGAAGKATTADWSSRVKIAGDLRYRHEAIDDAVNAENRTRESVRARIAAAVQFNETIDGEIGVATGAPDPRGASAVLGAASSRKQIGLDVGYVRWRPVDRLAVIAGKMRQVFVRPGLSLFFDNEIRPEGLALTYDAGNGLFGSAFDYWLEERPQSADSMLLGGQLGWAGGGDEFKVKAGVGYWGYDNVKGRSPEFGNGIVSAFGNSVVGTGSDAVYRYDYDIGQLFADVTLRAGELPINLFADYAHNFAADDGRSDGYAVGVLVGKANAPKKWEVGVMRQAIEKDALFAQWTDSDFAGGVTDNAGQLYRVAWMPMRSVLLNLTYYDTAYNVDVGDETDYNRWQLDFNFTF